MTVLSLCCIEGTHRSLNLFAKQIKSIWFPHQKVLRELKFPVILSNFYFTVWPVWWQTGVTSQQTTKHAANMYLSICMG